MEQYVVIAKPVENAKNKFEDYKILKADAEIPEGYVKRFGSGTLDECVRYLNEINENSAQWFRLTKWQYYLIFIVTGTFVAVLSYGAYYLPNFIQKDSNGNLISNQDDSARILITFLVAVGTIAIAVLATLTAMVIRDFEKRFVLAKEVLTILVGILGTIVGFYFGTANNPASRDRGNTNSNANSTRQNPTPTPTPTATPTPNANGQTSFFRVPSETGNYVLYKNNLRETS